MRVRLMVEADLLATARVHEQVFSRQKHSLEWLQCSFNAAPRTLIFVAEEHNEVVGYITWTQKSGFRPEAVVELEQLAVLPNHQGQGIGQALILDSLLLLKTQLRLSGSIIKHILVSTRSDNDAQKLYKKTLNAQVETTISDLYSADEVLMIARNISV